MISGYNLHFTCAQNDHTVNLIVIQRLQSVPNYWESVPNYWEGTWSEHVYWVSIVKVVTAFLRTYRKRKIRSLILLHSHCNSLMVHLCGMWGPPVRLSEKMQKLVSKKSHITSTYSGEGHFPSLLKLFMYMVRNERYIG